MPGLKPFHDSPTTRTERLAVMARVHNEDVREVNADWDRANRTLMVEDAETDEYLGGIDDGDTVLPVDIPVVKAINFTSCRSDDELAEAIEAVKAVGIWATDSRQPGSTPVFL